MGTTHMDMNNQIVTQKSRNGLYSKLISQNNVSSTPQSLETTIIDIEYFKLQTILHLNRVVLRAYRLF